MAKSGGGSEVWKPWSLKSGEEGSSLAALQKFTPMLECDGHSENIY